MADNIVRHDWNGKAIEQRASDGFVNLTDICKADGRRVGDYLDLPGTKAYIQGLATDLGLLPDNLVIKKRGRNGSTFAHLEIAIDCAQWISVPFRIWANRVLRLVLADKFEAKTASAAIAQSQLKQQYSRILDVPDPWVRLFEKDFCDRIFNWFGCSFYWQYAYCELTPEEICKLDRLNPPVKGVRDCKIHQYLSQETRDRLKPYLSELTALADGAATREDFILGYARHFGGNDQLRLFK